MAGALWDMTCACFSLHAPGDSWGHLSNGTTASWTTAAEWIQKQDHWKMVDNDNVYCMI